MGIISYEKTFRLLQEKGINTTSLLKDKNRPIRIGNSAYDSMKAHGHINTKTICTLCKLLDCQPGDLMEYIPDDQVESFLQSQAEKEAAVKRERQVKRSKSN